MDILQVLAPLLGVLLGGMIAGAGSVYRLRRERRGHAGRALADLLEVRHHVSAVEACLKEAQARSALPTEASLLVRRLVQVVSPVDARVHERYGAAVSLLASTDPLLAFELRSKDELSVVLAQVQGTVESAGIPADAAVEILDSLTETTLPVLDAALLKLARMHSRQSHVRVQAHLKSSVSVPEGVASIWRHAGQDPGVQPGSAPPR